MNVREFMKHRGRIERKYQNESQRRTAIRHLVREAGAAVVIMGGKMTGWRLKDGTIVCVKRRHKDEAGAQEEMARAHSSNWNGHRVPTRAYKCPHCHGWHLTSQPAQFDQAA